MGELGCWVDSKVTQIMQTGLEHSRVPDVLGYLGIREAFFGLSCWGKEISLTYRGSALPQMTDSLRRRTMFRSLHSTEHRLLD